MSISSLHLHNNNNNNNSYYYYYYYYYYYNTWSINAYGAHSCTTQSLGSPDKCITAPDGCQPMDQAHELEPL